MSTTKRKREYKTVKAIVSVPLEVEVSCDVTDPDRVHFAAAELTGTLSDDRLLRAVREQSAAVMRSLNRQRGGRCGHG